MKLESLYENYITSGQSASAAEKLPPLLIQAGYGVEGNAMLHYLNGGDEKAFDVVWAEKKRKCFSGPQLPVHAVPGDLWFDTVELALMIMVPHAETNESKYWFWITTHPVYVWQFRVFLRLVKWHLKDKWFMNVADLLSPARFEDVDPFSFVTNVYHEEAASYAHWFGKDMCDQLALKFTGAYLDEKSFLQILPPGMRSWDGGEFSSSEFVRIATGMDSIDMDPHEEFDRYEEEGYRPRLLAGEWERSGSIGFGTSVSMQVGLLTESPIGGYEFVEMENPVARKRGSFGEQRRTKKTK